MTEGDNVVRSAAPPVVGSELPAAPAQSGGPHSHQAQSHLLHLQVLLLLPLLLPLLLLLFPLVLVVQAHWA